MKKAIKVCLIFLAVIVLLCAAGLGYFYSRGTQTATGRFLRAKDGTPMIIADNVGAAVLSSDKVSFDKYNDGDKLIMRCSDFLETYPASVTAFLCFRTEEGDISDIPEVQLDSLRELGWIE